MATKRNIRKPKSNQIEPNRKSRSRSRDRTRWRGTRERECRTLVSMSITEKRKRDQIRLAQNAYTNSTATQGKGERGYVRKKEYNAKTMSRRADPNAGGAVGIRPIVQIASITSQPNPDGGRPGVRGDQLMCENNNVVVAEVRLQ